jgi:hypothetical protein
MSHDFVNWIHKFGRNTDIDIAAAEDVIDQGGDYAGWLAAAATPTISSANAADDIGNTGALTVTVSGLDTNYVPQSETVGMDGTTSVSLANSYIRVFRAFVATAGSNGTNAGNIDIVSAGNILARIPAGLGQTLQAIYTIPAQYENSLITSWWWQPMVTANTTVAAAIQTRNSGTNAWRTREWVQVRTAGAGDHYRDFGDKGITVDAQTDIRLRVLSTSSDDTIVSGGFDIVLL